MLPQESGPPRTYVRREGRMTDGQKRAMTDLLPRFVYPQELTAPASVFGRDAPLVIEIGFGNGENLAAQAQQHPDTNYIGLEVHRPGVGALLQAADEQGLSNLRVSSNDALHFLCDQIPPACADVVQIFFPDPWPKKRHHKRRIVRDQALDLVSRCLQPGGVLLLATDWDNYAEQMMEVMSAHTSFDNRHGVGEFAPRADRVLTRFEKRAHRLGHSIHDLAFIKKL
jgi:tRNA (guanine-N7-)-methyltransferase